jgi:hypothetical protein
MNRTEAYRILASELASYRELDHADIAALVGEELSRMKHGNDGCDYTVAVSIRWHSESNADVLVSGSVTLSDWGSPHDRLEDSFVVSKTKLSED